MGRSSIRMKKEVISYVLAFILALSIIGLSLMTFGKYSMMSEHAIFNTCNRIGYYSMIRDEIKETAYEIGIPYGVTKKDLKNVFTVKEVRKDIMNVVHSKADKQDYIVDTSEPGKRLIANIKDAYTETGKEWTDTNEKALVEYLTAVEDMYQDKMEIPGIDNILSSIRVFNKVIIVGIPIAILSIVLCAFFLISIRRFVHHGLRFIGYGVLGAALTLVILFAGCISNGFIYRINISDVYLRKFYTFWVGHAMLIQVFDGIFIGVAGLILILIIYRYKRRINME